MSHILTDAEGAVFVRTTETDVVMLQLLDLVDAQIQSATGRDWTQDTPAHGLAKTAAGILLTEWYDNPALVGTTPARAVGVLTQLEVEALKYRSYTVYGLNGAGGVYIPDAKVGDEVVKVIGLYGVTGDQSASFESAVSVNYALQQTSASDLSDNVYYIVLKSPAEDQSP